MRSVRHRFPAPQILASVFALVVLGAAGGPVLADCPARISSATIIGRTSSGASSIYAISVDIDDISESDPLTMEMNGMHLYVHDNAGNETWIFVPAHNVSDWNHGRRVDYFSFGWRHSQNFQISVSDITIGGSTVVCGNDWRPGSFASDVVLSAGNSWDGWSHNSRPKVDLVKFHPARLVNEAEIHLRSSGPLEGECEILVSVDAAGHPTAFDVFKTSGYRPFDDECVDAAKRSTYSAATFGATSVAATWIEDWAYKTLE